MEFPFVRDREYPFADLRSFRSGLLDYRQKNREFSDALRRNKIPWAKVYNEEIVPLALLADEKGYGEKETFRLMPKGDPADAELGFADCKRLCQITLADPIWPGMNPKSGSGYPHSLKMELLSKSLPAFGGGKAYKKRGDIVSEPHAVDQQDRNAAYRLGLIRAIVRKQKHDGSGFALLIYARELCFQLIDCDRSALSDFVSDAMRDIGDIKFGPLWVVDDGFLWEHR